MSKLGRPSKNDPNRVGPLQDALIAIIEKEPEEASAVRMIRKLTERGMPISSGQIGMALKRLERRGFIRPRTGGSMVAAPRRRGRPEKFYEITQREQS